MFSYLLLQSWPAVAEDMEKDTESTHKSAVADVDAEPLLYEDQYCKLTANNLTLKKYFFPLAKPKEIPISAIRRIFYKKQEFLDDAFKSKDWGLTLTPVWWGCDIARFASGFSMGFDWSSHSDSGI